MPESLINPRKQLALDTDWATAISMFLFFVICALSAARSVWVLSRSSFQASDMSFQTLLIAACFSWVAYKGPEKMLKIAAFLLAVGPLMQILLWLFRASPDTQRMNSVFYRCFDILVFIGGCVYVVNWFRTRIKHV